MATPTLPTSPAIKGYPSHTRTGLQGPWPDWGLASRPVIYSVYNNPACPQAFHIRNSRRHVSNRNRTGPWPPFWRYRSGIKGINAGRKRIFSRKAHLGQEIKVRSIQGGIKTAGSLFQIRKTLQGFLYRFFLPILPFLTYLFVLVAHGLPSILKCLNCRVKV